MIRARTLFFVFIGWLLCPLSGWSTEAGPIDLAVIGAEFFSPGAPADVRVFARTVAGMTDFSPLHDARLKLTLCDMAGREAVLYDGPVDSAGAQEIHFSVPPWPTGQARLEVRLLSASGRRRVSLPIELRRRAHLWLQSGWGSREDGRLDVRAVLLDDDLRPLGRLPIRFAIEDGDGRPLTELEANTDPDGIASATLAHSAEARWIAAEAPGLDGAIQRQALLPSGRSAAEERISIWAEGGRLFAGLLNPLFVLSRSSRPVVIELAGTGASTVNELGLAPLTLPRAPRPPASLRFTIREEGREPAEREQSFPSAPPGAIRLSIDQVFFPPEATLQAIVETQAEDGPCHLDVLARGRTVQTATAPLRRGRAIFELRLAPEAAGTITLHAYRIRDTGELVEDTRLIYVKPRALYEITVQRRQPTFATGEEAHLWVRVSDQTGAPRSAVLGVSLSAAPGGPGPLLPDLDILAAPELRRACLPESLWTRALSHPETLPAAYQRFAAATLAGAPLPRARRVFWSSAAERIKRAEEDHLAIQKALDLDPALALMPIGQRTESGWSYPADLLERLIESGALPERHRLDPLGQPYTPATIVRLWPDLAPERVLGKCELTRLGRLRQTLAEEIRLEGEVSRDPAALLIAITKAWSKLDRRSPGLLRDPAFEPYSLTTLRALPGFADEDFQDLLQGPRIDRLRVALRRYAEESRSWFRLPLGPLPEDLVHGLIRRGLIVPANGRDLWGHRYRLEPGPIDGAVIVSDGPDGVPGSADDRRFTPGADRGFALLARKLIGEEESRAEPARSPGACPRPRFGGVLPLVHLPPLKTDQNGLAELRIPLPTEAGRIRLKITAHSQDGGVGVATHTIDVR